MALLERLKLFLWRRDSASIFKGPRVNYRPLEPQQRSDEDGHPDAPPGTRGRKFLWLNWGLFVLSVICLAQSYRHSHQSYQWHLKQTLGYSPFLDKINLGALVDRHEENELFDRPSAYRVYRGQPSEEVDAAWDAIAEVGVVTISSEHVRKVGKKPSETVKAPVHWEYGDDAYLAQVDGQHRLHCLNILRKWMHYDHYFRPFLGDDPGIIQLSHRDHCLVLLLQTLTCQVSLDVITHNWMDTQQYPVPDFNMNRKCMDHSKILDWQARNRITMDQWDEIAPQPGDFMLPLWPELVELNRLHGWNVTYKVQGTHQHGDGAGHHG